MKALAIWVFDNIRLPSFLAPWVFGYIIAKKPHKVKKGPKK